MPISPIADVAKANDKYRAQLRSTWISDPADASLLVNAVPENVPTYVTVGWNTDLETVFLVEGKSGDSSANYALTGVTRVKGANVNLPENTPVNCLNHEEFFNQYEEKINSVIDNINDAIDVVNDLEEIVQGDWVDIADSSSMTIDWQDGAQRKFRIEALAADGTLVFNNERSGVGILIRIIQGATPRTITWPAGITWQGIEDDPDTDTYLPANKTGSFVFVCTGTDTYDGFFLGVEA